MEEKFLSRPLNKALHITDIISLNRWKHSKTHYYEGEKHDFWELLYVENGRILVSSGKRQHILEKGELLFHQPNDFHAIHAIEGAYAQTICSAFCCDSEFMDYFCHSIFTLNDREQRYLQDALEVIMREIYPIDPDVIGRNEINKKFATVLQIVRENIELLLLNLYYRGEKTPLIEPAYFRKNAYATNIAEEITTYLEANITNKLTLQEISADLGYSVSHLEKLYMLHTGKKIIDSFIAMKMERACHLLAEEKLDVSKVAVMLGYNNIPHFSRQFKARMGISPSLYAHSRETANDSAV